MSKRARVVGIGVFIGLWCTGIVFGGTREVGPNAAFATPCEAIEAAEPGDIININAGVYSGGSCTIRTPDVQIRGVAGTPKVSGSDVSGDLWQIAADGVSIDNVEFAGAKCEGNACSVLRIYGKNVTLTNVSVHGSNFGVKADNASGSSLVIRQSDISDNTTNVFVGKVSQFTLQSSYLHNANGGDQVHTEALRNEITDNRIGNASSEDRRELVIDNASSSVVASNTIIKGARSMDTAMLQTVSHKNVSPTLDLTNNTFVSYLAKGSLFVEHVGNSEVQIQTHRNIFWGSAVLVPYAVAQSSDNYAGTGLIFEDEASFHVISGTVPADWGAPSVATAPVSGKMTSRPEVTVVPSITSITLATNPVFGAGYIFGNTVTLSSAAPVGGLVVTMASDKPQVATFLSPTITIAAGKTSGTFILQTTAQTAATAVAVTATLPGGQPFSAPTLMVGPVSLSAVTLESAAVGGGLTTLTNKVIVSGPAPAGGMTITLTSSKASAQVPAIVYIPAGMTSATFPIITTVVSAPEDAVITATHPTGTVSVTLAVKPVELSNLLLVTGGSIVGGYQVLVKAQLNGPAPLGGSTVALTSSNPGVAPITGSVTVAEGDTEISTDSLTRYVASATPVTFSATMDVITKPAVLTVNPVALFSLTSPASVKAASKITLTIKLNGLAPAAGFPVTLSSSNSAIAPVVSSVVVPPGSTSATVQITAGAVTVATPVTVKAIVGTVQKTCTFTVNP